MAAFDKYVIGLEHGTVQERAVAIALRYGQVDGEHHARWVIDQMLRVLAGADYDRAIELHNAGGEYSWDCGIAP